MDETTFFYFSGQEVIAIKAAIHSGMLALAAMRRER
jgi:hypothetical protein